MFSTKAKKKVGENMTSVQITLTRYVITEKISRKELEIQIQIEKEKGV